MPVIVHGAHVSPPCLSVLLTAKAIGLEIQLNEFDVLSGLEIQTEAYRKMNPAHSAPTLDDNGFHIWESRAIMCYLVNQYAKDDQLYPKDPKKRALVDNMLQFDLGALYASFADLFYSKMFFEKDPSSDAEAKVKDGLEILDMILSRNDYVAGTKLTIADFSIMISINVASIFDYSLDLYPNIKKWEEKVKSEVPYYEEVTKKGMDQLQAIVDEKKTA